MGNNMENVLEKIQRLRFFVIHYRYKKDCFEVGIILKQSCFLWRADEEARTYY